MTIHDIKERVDIVEVVSRYVKLRRTGRAFAGRCPFHDDRRPSLVVFPEGDFRCFGCGARGDVIDFVALIERIDTREALRRLSSEVLMTASRTRILRKPKVERPRDPAVAEIDRRHRVYEAMLRYLTLSEDHWRHLVDERRFSEEDVRRLEYRTLSFADREAIPALIALDLGEQALVGVPGFYRKDGTWRLGGTPGIVIPVRDTHGRIQGCQIRANDPEHGRYQWLSSAGKEGGASPGTPCHVARAGEGQVRRVFLTEGPLKADFVAARLKATCLGVAGVANWRSALGCLRELQAREAVLAFDQDEKEETREAVEAHVAELAGKLRESGLRVLRATWAEGKGIDDALRAGKAVTIHKTA